MELRTEAINRVLEALGPALDAELGRVSEEVRQTLEAEFRDKIELAVAEAEEAARQRAEIQLRDAIEHAVDSTRRQVTEELEAQFNRKLQETTEEILGESLKAIEDSAAAWLQEKSALQVQIDDWRLFANAQRQLAEASSQPEMLLRFLKLAERFAASVAVYVAKPDGLAMWKSRGDVAFPSVVTPDSVDPEFYFQQIIVRDTVVAAVCAVQPYNAEALVFLAECLHRAVELFGLRLSSPTLRTPSVEPPV